jgi:ribosomal protein L27
MHNARLVALALFVAGGCTSVFASNPPPAPGSRAAESTPAVAGKKQAAANGLDAAARARLVGDHILTLQWLGWGDLSRAGKIVIEDRGETLTVSGEQTGTGDEADGYLKISGKIVSASKDGFVFVGDIATRISHIAEGAECKRSGTFTFKTKGGRKYWRMQEMTNPCDPVTDYVDVYFRGI